MIVNYSLKYIFMDVPKTGSSSVVKWLTENDKDSQKKIVSDKTVDCTHIRYVLLEELLKDELKEFKVIAVVRDPFERVRSAYSFYKKGAKKGLMDDSIRNPFSLKFKILISRILPFWFWILIYPLKKSSYFIKAKDGSVKIDYLINYKDLNSELPKVLNKLGLNIQSDIPKVNVSQKKHKKTKKFSSIEKFVLDLKYGGEKSLI